MDANLDMLRRIAVLLVALAGLAERAGSRSAPVRYVVLWLLRPAEAAAREFAGQVGAPPAMLADWPEARSANGRDDALRLAQEFLALAAVFHALCLKTLAGLRRPAVRREISRRVAGVRAIAVRPPRPIAAHRCRAPPEHRAFLFTIGA